MTTVVLFITIDWVNFWSSTHFGILTSNELRSEILQLLQMEE